MEDERLGLWGTWLRRGRSRRALAWFGVVGALVGVLSFSQDLLAQAVASLFEDFESGGFEAGTSDWRNVTGDDIDWRRLSGATPSNNTGPSGDATTGTGFYIYTEASAADGGSPNMEALLAGPCVDLTTAGEASWSFEYHMFGGDMGTLEAQVAPGCGGAFQTVFSRSGNQGTAYQTAMIDLAPFLGQNLGLRLRAVTGPDFESDIAVDDLAVDVTELQSCGLDAECDDGLFCNGVEVCSAGFCAPSPDPAPCSDPGLSCDEALDQCVAAPVAILGPDDFEAGFGSWSNLSGDDIDWRRLSGGTPSNGTGPSGDHTTGSGFYLYTEASAADGGSPNMEALLESPCVDLAGTSSAHWTFFYHMLGTTMGSLEAQVDVGCTGSYATRFSVSGNQGNQYLLGDVDLSDLVGGQVRLRFRAVTGSDFESDITIDDVLVEATLDAGCSFDSDCDDGSTCTTDVCNAGTCENTPMPDGATCSDGDQCTQVDTCQAGTCVGASPVVCTASDQCHDVGICDPATGLCSDPELPDGTTCDDGDLCTDSTCQAGLCAAGPPVVCTASDACHLAGTCDPGTGLCSDPPAPDGTTCSDGDQCTQTDTCQSGSCQGSNPVVCTASDQCHDAGVCDPATGVCSDPPKPDGTTCDDGTSCTDDTCESGSCQGVSNCPVGQSCDVPQDICVDAGCVVDADCDDGNASTIDTCDGSSTCQNTPDPTCVAVFPNVNDFDGGFGDWVNVAGDDIDWRRNSGGTPSSGTGPPGDNTSGSGFYVYTEASAADGGSPNMEALLDGPCFDLSSADTVTWSFFYHMQGADMGMLEAQVAPDCSGSFSTVFMVSGDQGGAYNEATIDLSAFAGSQVALRLRAVTGPDFASDIAVDDITVDVTALQTCGIDADCDDGLFCNGVEVCSGGFCAPGSDPCSGPGLTCDEGLDRCVAAPVAILGPDDFESGFGNWSNLPGDDIDWRRLSGGTPSNGTGPSGDHTTGAGFYLYTEASAADGGSPNMEALLESPCIDLAGTNSARWTFFHHMLGTTMGSLEGQVDAGCTGSYATRFSVSGNQGNQYLLADVDLSDLVGGQVRLRFRAVTGSDFESDITIDDVLVEATLDAGCSFDSDCDDGSTCTTDVCNAGTCENTPMPDGATCSDGDQCTQVDTCQAGTCVGASPVVCTASDQCHDAGACDPATGLCSDPALPDGTTCDDGDLCTDSTCQAGACAAGPPVVCTASDACHLAGTCDPGTGLCSDPPAPDGTTCSDGDQCTQADTCQSGSCQGSNPVVCTASDQCHDAGICDPATGVCSDPPKPDGTTCDDGTSCTDDTCQGGACQGVSNCPAGQSCDVPQDICVDAGCVVDADCDDGNACTIDTCDGSSTCQNTPDPTCVAAFPNVNDFDAGFGDWVNVSGDDIDWRRNSGGTPSSGTGPPGDNTSGSGFYVYTEASAADGGSPNMEALLDGPCFDLSSADTVTWSFFYHMQGADMGMLEAQVAPDCSGSFSTVFMVSGDQGGAYNEATIDLSAFAGSQVALRLRAVTGPDFASDIAVDDITVDVTELQTCGIDADCDDGLFCNGVEVCSGGFCASGSDPCSGPGLTCDEALDQCVTAPVAILGPDDFESGFGNWSNLPGDDIDWRRDSGGTPSNGTGPSGDHTTGAGFYLYTEASAADGGSPNMEALLESPCIDLAGTSSARWTFFYHMLGTTMGSLEGQVDVGCTGSYATRFSVSGNQGNQYLLGDVDLSDLVGGQVRLRFRAVTGSDFESDITIDDVLVEATLDAGCSFDSDCDDGSTCTTDVCNAGTCENTPVSDGTTCSDGDQCTQVDTCQAGACVGGSPVVCTASDQCHDVGTCDPATGLCSDPALPDGTTCDDGDLCTDSTCQAGACAAGPPVVCTASDACHLPGTCNPSTGLCSDPPAPDGTTCSDGDACTQTDTCQSGTCEGSDPVVCSASDDCHDAGVCDPATGACSDPPKPDGSTCDDGAACTDDTCQGGVCEGVSNCPTGQVCDVPSDMCMAGCMDDAECDDGDPCTLDSCGGEGQCVATPDPSSCVVQFPAVEDFESTPFTFANVTSDDFDWIFQSGPNGGTFPGPDGDHTTGSGTYALVLSQSGAEFFGMQAVLEGACVDLSSVAAAELTFFYHQTGFTGAPLSTLEAQVAPDCDGASWQTRFSSTQDQGDDYQQGRVDLSEFAGGRVALRFVVTLTGNPFSDIALDDIRVDTSSVQSPALDDITLPVTANPITQTGQADPGAVVELFVDGSSQGTTGVAGDGTFGIDFSVPGPGRYTLQAVATLGAETSFPSAERRLLFGDFPLQEDMEQEIALFGNVDTDDRDWARLTGPVPNRASFPRGPAGDNTTGSGFYLYTEGSFGSLASLESACIDLSSGPASAELRFFYHFYNPGSLDFGAMAVQVAPDCGTFTDQPFTIVGDQGDQWLEGSVDLGPYLGGSVRLRFITSGFATGLDDVSVDVRNVAPPTIDPLPLPITANPVTITGSAGPGHQISVFLDGALAATTVAAGDGSFSADITVQPTPQILTATASDGVETSFPSAPRTIAFGETLLTDPILPASIDTPSALDPTVTYTATSFVSVPDGSSLRIPEGTTVRFEANTGLDVIGALLIEGTSPGSVRFVSAATNPAQGDWVGVLFDSGGAAGPRSIANLEVSHADRCLLFGPGETALVENVTLLECFTGVEINNAGVVVRTSTIQNAAYRPTNFTLGVDIFDPLPGTLIEEVSITGFEYGVYLLDGGTATVQRNVITETYEGLSVRGSGASLITENTVTDCFYSFRIRPFVDVGEVFQTQITGNNFIANDRPFIQDANASVQLVDVSGNYFGTTDADQIAANVTFGLSGSTRVIWYPFLDAPFDTGGQLTPAGPDVLSGVVSQDLTLDPATTYRLALGYFVAPGVTLTIPPGTRVVVDDRTTFTFPQLLSYGTLDARGAAGSEIEFTSVVPDDVAGRWVGIVITAGGTALIDHALIEKSDAGVAASAAQHVEVRNSTIRTFSGNGITIGTSSVTSTTVTGRIESNLIDQRGFGQFGPAGIRLGSNVELSAVRGNVVRGSSIGLEVETRFDSPTLTIEDNLIEGNSTGAFLWFGGSPIFVRNRFIDNTFEGVSILESFSPMPGHPVFRGNEFSGNGTDNLRVRDQNATLVVDAEENFWGVTSEFQISPTIFDGRVDPAHATVDFCPFLDAFDGTVIPCGAPIPRNIDNFGLYADAELTPGPPYTISGSLGVDVGSTLTIQPGTTLEFAPNASLAVNGSLIAESPSADIVLTSAGGSPLPGDWRGVSVDTETAQLVLDGVTIEYAQTGVHLFGGGDPATTFIVRDSQITNFTNDGIRTGDFGGSNPSNVTTQSGVIEGNLIENFPVAPSSRTTFGLSLLSPAPSALPAQTLLVSGNTIRGHRRGIFVTRAAPTILGNTITDNDVGVFLEGTAATGGNPAPTISGNSVFENFAGAGAPVENIVLRDFALPLGEPIDATGNFFGETDPAAVRATIVLRNSPIPPLDFSGFLDSPGGVAAPGSENQFTTRVLFESLSSRDIRPIDGDTVTYSFRLTVPGDVEVQVYGEADAALAQSFRTIDVGALGTQSTQVTWDGRDDSGSLLPDAAYKFVVNADFGGGSSEVFDPPAPVEDPSLSVSLPARYAPLENDHLEFDYRLNASSNAKPAKVNLVIGLAGTPINFLRKADALPCVATGNCFFAVEDLAIPVGEQVPISFDGRGPDGNIITDSIRWSLPIPDPLRSAAVLVRGGTPQVTGDQAAPNVEVRSNPYLMIHSYEQITNITYRIDRDAIVTVKLLTPGAPSQAQEVVTIVDNVLQQAVDGMGDPIDHVATYLGYGSGPGESNDILSPVEGVYTFEIEARDPTEPLLRSVRRSVVTIRR